VRIVGAAAGHTSNVPDLGEAAGVERSGDDRRRRPARVRFSDELEDWLAGDPHKTFGDMVDVFGERGFAVGILMTLCVPALPLPTGGVSHVLELIAILLAVQMVLGRTVVWLPQRLRRREIGPALAKKALPFVVRKVRWLEKRSRPRLARLFHNRWFLRLLGLVMIALTIGSALAPPFSGLDTLPALGAVLIALAILLEDVALLIIGVAVGTGGIALIVTVGTAVAHFLRNLF
jgi:hypothetical protein